MILTVTLNAAIDKRYVVEDFKIGEVDRVKECVYTPGGKGLNVSKPASIAGAKVVATGFVGGHAGNYIEAELKPFGIEIVERMNDLGIIVDVSHLSDGGLWDVLKHSKKPVIASHSNARALCDHQRNLTDEMIRALAEKGGVSGINFYPYFLNESGKANIDDLIRHIEHMYYVGGEDFVAMGTDFDGFNDGELDIKHLGQINYLYEALKKRKFNDSQIEKFWNKNAMRIIKEVL